MWSWKPKLGRTLMDRHWLSSESNLDEHAVAADCLARVRSRVSPGEFGYRIQALAGHVLLGLGHSIVEVKQKGHPDLVSVKDGQEFRFEVEAEVVGRKKRMLTPSDFEGLIDTSVEGYFALAVSFPRPFWVLVPASRLVQRELRAGTALLKALSNKEFSCEWTNEYASLISRSFRDVVDRSFDQLVQRALDGRGL